MNIDEVVKVACSKGSLVEALDWICIWESERVVKQAHYNLTNGIKDSEGRSWDTCFRICIERVMKEWR